jgi:hypothetical protein
MRHSPGVGCLNRGRQAGDPRLQTALGGQLCRLLLLGRRDPLEFLDVHLVTGDFALGLVLGSLGSRVSRRRGRTGGLD